MGRAPRFWQGTVIGMVIVSGALSACSTPPATSAATRPPPPSDAPVGGVNPAISTTPGARTSVVAYGPFTIPAATGTAHGQEGMSPNQLRFGIAKPCTDCYVTGIQADLKLPGGRVANTDTGQVLHHIVLGSSARVDATCGTTLLALFGERFFASGNERTRARFPAGYGYAVGAADGWNLMYELMNTDLEPVDVTIEVTYDWVPSTTASMTPLRPVWLDVATCLNSTAPAQTGAYSYSSSWVVNVPGKIIGAGAHLHEGGTHLTLVNETTGQLICDSVAGYGGPGYEGPTSASDGHDHGGGGGAGALQHLSSMSQCVAPDGDRPVATISRGERIRTTAYYDTEQHAPHGNHPVMGIAVIFVAPR